MIQKTAYAKLDLAIHIESRKTAGGIYPVRYIDCQLDICDKLTFESSEGKIEVFCSNPELSDEKNNFVWRAAVLLKKIAGGRRLGAKITLEKNIPIKAGFGGGSSDGAAAILGLSELWQIKLKKSQIETLAKNLGKDFYYSLKGGLSEIVSEGKNYELKPIGADLPKFWLLILVPRVQKPSTGWIYQHLNREKIGKNPSAVAKLKKAILAGKRGNILANLHNHF